MAKGWIKLHRKIQECDLWISDEPFDCRSAWIDLLLSANHEDKSMLFDGHLISIGRGQLITSVRKLSVKWNWGKDKTLKFLNLLQELQMLEKNSDSRRTLLTIVNYDNYQIKDTDEQTLTQTVSRQYADTDADTDKPQTRNIKNIKNEKNDKEDKNSIREKFTPPSLEEVQAYVFEKNINIDAEAFFDHFTSNGWLVGGKSKMKDWKAAVRNWERNERKWNNNKPSNGQRNLMQELMDL